MAITTSGTTLTFNDTTTQTTAPVNTSANVNSVSAGTGISVSATTGALTVTNSGVTSAVAGTGITVSGATGAVTISSTATGTVTSVATGNGLSGGTITGSGTLVIAAPTAGSVGSYVFALGQNTASNQSYLVYNTNYAAGTAQNASAIYLGSLVASTSSYGGSTQTVGGDGTIYYNGLNGLSGTWKWLSATTQNNGSGSFFGLAVRVS